MPKVCVVTGANAGIGLAASRQLVERGATVLMVGRSLERLERAQRSVGGDSQTMVCDLGDLVAVRRLSAEIANRSDKVDVLINNAAIFDLNVKEAVMSPQGHEQVWAANHLGPFLLTQLLLPELRNAEGRVITISSQGSRRSRDSNSISMTWIAESILGQRRRITGRNWLNACSPSRFMRGRAPFHQTV